MAKTEKVKKGAKKKGSGKVSTFILLLILLAGLGLLLYPTVADWWNSFHQTRAVASYIEAVENIDSGEAEAMLAQADAFNSLLARTGVHFPLSQEEGAMYQQLLDVNGDGIMGYVEIPSIKVYLPIYHGTGDAILQVATGHLEGTSLPVGGASTHCAISGHRGLPSARLFTDLDQLEEGDIFMVTVLTRKITYVVDQIRIVLPEEVEDLEITPGEDYCTLVTCTPYGVNSHRMLVRGTRIENLPDEVLVMPDARRVSTYIVIPAVGVPLLFLLLTGMLFYYSFRKPRKSGKQLLEEFKSKEDEKPEKPEKRDKPSSGGA